MRHFIITRQQHLIERKHSKSVQANTILVTGIPSRYLTQNALFKLFNCLPGGVKKIWINRYAFIPCSTLPLIIFHLLSHYYSFENNFLIYTLGIWRSFQTSMTDVLQHAPHSSQQKLHYLKPPLNYDSKPSKRPPRTEPMSKPLIKSLSKFLNPSDQRTNLASSVCLDRKWIPSTGHVKK